MRRWWLFLMMGACTTPADVKYVNATVYTGDSTASALAVRDGVVVSHDPDAPARETIDLGGAVVVPGFVDAHAHLGGLGGALRRVDLVDVRGYDELIARVRAWPGDGWITGRGWNQELWDDTRMPTHHRLSEAVPDRPVWLRRVDGHAGLANAAAMRLAGVTRDTPDPAGGDVLHGDDGEPTGVFVDAAMGLIERHVPGTGDAKADLLAAQELCLRDGLVGVHDMGVGPGGLRAYEDLLAEGRLKLRIYAMLDADGAIDHMSRVLPSVGDRLTIRGVKLYMDGALGSRGAWLLAPYSDIPKNDRGEPNVGLPGDVAAVRAIADVAKSRGYQVAIHAIGDRGVRESLAILRGHDRPRIEHAQIIAFDDLDAFEGVIASMQPTHATSDMNMAEDRVGPNRIMGGYAWASLLRRGVVVAAGSDFPVESHKPLWGFYAAVTRSDHDGNPPGGWTAHQAMTREEALRAFTWGAAYAAFEEERAGTLETGKRADFVVLDTDIMTCPVERILKARVIRTVIGGEAVYVR